jgi:hypothetical protein
MFTILNSIYDNVVVTYMIYDVIKRADEPDENHNKREKTVDEILLQLNNIVLKEDVFSIPDTKAGAAAEKCTQLSCSDLNFQQYKLDNSMYQLNFLRSDMIHWKNSKRNYTYSCESDWEYINDPDNLPRNNYLLYLLENIPENITYNKNNNNNNKNNNKNNNNNKNKNKNNNKNNNNNKNKNKNGWKRADEIGFEKEACAILNKNELGEGEDENIWIDSRLLGEKWLGLFYSISENDSPIEIPSPQLS